jgi:hypothetical protein
LDPLDPLVLLEKMGQQDLQELLVLDLQDPLALLEKMDPQAPLVHQDLQAHKDPPAHKEYLAQLLEKAIRAKPAHKGPPATPAHKEETVLRPQ